MQDYEKKYLLASNITHFTSKSFICSHLFEKIKLFFIHHILFHTRSTVHFLIFTVSSFRSFFTQSWDTSSYIFHVFLTSFSSFELHARTWTASLIRILPSFHTISYSFPWFLSNVASDQYRKFSSGKHMKAYVSEVNIFCSLYDTLEWISLSLHCNSIKLIEECDWMHLAVPSITVNYFAKPKKT